MPETTVIGAKTAPTGEGACDDVVVGTKMRRATRKGSSMVVCSGVLQTPTQSDCRSTPQETEVSKVH